MATVGGVWERFTGDTWEFRWDNTTDNDLSGWTEASLVVTFRDGPGAGDTVVAGTEEDPATVTTTGTNFAATNSVLAFQVDGSVTATISQGVVYVGATALNGSEPVTVLPPTAVKVVDQVAQQ